MTIRKQIALAIARTLGRPVRFSVRKVGFQDLARMDAYFVKLDPTERLAPSEWAVLEQELRKLRTAEYRVLFDPSVCSCT
jgi:hypothetical protein